MIHKLYINPKNKSLKQNESLVFIIKSVSGVGYWIILTAGPTTKLARNFRINLIFMQQPTWHEVVTVSNRAY